jgi:hypothetical protein
MVTKICKKCGEDKLLSEFNNDKYSSDGLRYRCRECTSKEYRIYYNLNKENEIKRQTEFQKNNKELTSKTRKKRYSIRYKNDVEYKVRTNLRNRVKLYLKSINLNVKLNNTKNFVGCDPNELREYLEGKFTDGMSWSNYSHDGWHIDHIIPLSSAKSIDEIYKLCHYTNLQPLWCFENYKKSNKTE